MSLYARLAALALAVVILAGIGWKIHHMGEVAGRADVQAKWNAANVAAERAAQAQADRNRELQRAAELRYTVRTETRDRFIVATVTEIRHDTENLAACVLTPAAVQRLHDAAECAGADRPASCRSGNAVQSPQ